NTMSAGLIVGLVIAGILVCGIIAFFVRKKLRVLKLNKRKSFLSDDFNDIFNVGSTEQHTASSSGGNARNIDNSVSRSRSNNDLNTERLNSKPSNNIMPSPNNRPIKNNSRGDERIYRTRMNDSRGGEGVHNFNNRSNERLNNRFNVNLPPPPPMAPPMSNIYSKKVPEMAPPYYPAVSVEQPSYGGPPPLETP
ncbi:1643_t:CDS:1, partial [Dentiscutata erythropus]